MVKPISAALAIAHCLTLPFNAVSSVRRPASLLTASAYAKRVGVINSCSALAGMNRPPLADALLMKLVNEDVGGTTLSGDQYQTTEANEERHRQAVVRALGGTDLVITRLSFLPFQVRYDADRGLMRMWNISGVGPLNSPFANQSNIRIGRKWITRSREERQNGFGAKAIVEAANVTDVSIGYDSAKIATKFRSGENIFGLTFPMSPADARAFVSAPSVLVMGKVIRPYVHQSSIFPEATIDNPLEGVITSIAFTIDARCILLMAGDRAIGTLQSDDPIARE